MKSNARASTIYGGLLGSLRRDPQILRRANADRVDHDGLAHGTTNATRKWRRRTRHAGC